MAIPKHRLNTVTSAQYVDKFENDLAEVLERQMAFEKRLQKSEDDVHTRFLKGKVVEINHLCEQIESFNNPGQHFTKSYRTMYGHAEKLITDLDSIDVFGRDALRQMRKELYLNLDDAIKLLGGKAHSTGKRCPQCDAV